MRYSLILLLLFAGALSAQSIDDIPLAELNAPYIEIVGVKKPLSNKLTIGIDYGQERKLFEFQQHIKDDRGNYIEFYSMIDALNFFAYYDYEFVQALTESSGNQQIYRYVLRKIYYAND